jgi:Trk K+ transport system NAD-binding subunit
MSLLENIKKTLKDGGERVVKIAEDITDKIKEVGEDGLELSKEVLADISEKTSDITNIARYKLELNEMQKNIDSEMQNLGELVFKMHTSKRKEKIEEKINTQIEVIETARKALLDKTTSYDNLRKTFSSNYVIQKLSDELAESDSVIDQVIVSGNSDSVNKKLKELILPKGALISAVKRSDQIIIPDGNTEILADDVVTIIGKKNDVTKVKNNLLSINKNKK